MDEETKKLVNQKIRDLLNSDDIFDFNRAVKLLESIKYSLIITQK